jgi:hypothetical protein
MTVSEARQVAQSIHGKILYWWDPNPGVDPKQCKLCGNHCALGAGQVGRCALWRNKGSKLRFLGQAGTAFLHHYLDPNPTNCCNVWFCPAGTGTVARDQLEHVNLGNAGLLGCDDVGI